MREKTIRLIAVVIIIIAIISAVFIYSGVLQQGNSFRVDALLFKSVIRQNESVSNVLKITNLKGMQDFSLGIEGIQGLVWPEESNFSLGTGESKTVKIVFRDAESKYIPGIYAGAITIRAGCCEKREIPVIIEMQSRKVFFATNIDISPAYKEILPGEKIAVGVKLFNLNDTKMHQVELTYAVKNLNDEAIFSETENMIVGAEAATTKTVVMPDDTPLGQYVFAVVTKFDSSVSTSSYLFSVVEKKASALPDYSYIITAVFIFLFAIVALAFYMTEERDKIFIELRKQHEREMKGIVERLNKQMEKSIAKAKEEAEKKKIEREFGRIKKKSIRKVVERHREQKAELRKLRRQKRRSEMEGRLREWKKEGYNVNEILAEVKKKPKKRGEQMRQWKKEGYDMSAVE